MQAAAMQLGLTVVVEEREDGAAGGRGEGIFELISAGDAAAMQEVTSYATKPPEKVQSPTSVTRAA